MYMYHDRLVDETRAPKVRTLKNVVIFTVAEARVSRFRMRADPPAYVLFTREEVGETLGARTGCTRWGLRRMFQTSPVER